MHPAELRSRNLIDGRISISFDNYKAASTSSRISYNTADNETFSDEEKIRSHIIAVNIQLSDDSDNEAEELRKNLNSYFQEIYVSEGEWEMPYPQKPQKEVIAAGLEEELVMEYPQLAKLSQQVYS
ncbi:hypothetical protein C4D60_Mb00t02690 [Musa balbisiana]|uniref:Uncharacterized protein n=1 Tax=Musa balbisiana TaxID=52838 RepID=A0A4S8I7D0_MUSBA|nr:hypothetical protein C4D60_Mb00t02690 [Musa balbisiana]